MSRRCERADLGQLPVFSVPIASLGLCRQSASYMERLKMQSQTFGNVFEALADTPAEAANMKARSELLSALKARVDSWGVSQEIAAAKLGITRPRLSDLLLGKMGKFSLDALVNLTAAAGLELQIRVLKPA
jgi:predicted XRE-type DNA-binding protein